MNPKMMNKPHRSCICFSYVIRNIRYSDICLSIVNPKIVNRQSLSGSSPKNRLSALSLRQTLEYVSFGLSESLF